MPSLEAYPSYCTSSPDKLETHEPGISIVPTKKNRKTTFHCFKSLDVDTIKLNYMHFTNDENLKTSLVMPIF